MSDIMIQIGRVRKKFGDGVIRTPFGEIPLGSEITPPDLQSFGDFAGNFYKSYKRETDIKIQRSALVTERYTEIENTAPSQFLTAKFCKEEYFRKKFTFTRLAVRSKGYWKTRANGDPVQITNIRDNGCTWVNTFRGNIFPCQFYFTARC